MLTPRTVTPLFPTTPWLKFILTLWALLVIPMVVSNPERDPYSFRKILLEKKSSPSKFLPGPLSLSSDVHQILTEPSTQKVIQELPPNPSRNWASASTSRGRGKSKENSTKPSTNHIMGTSTMPDLPESVSTTTNYDKLFISASPSTNTRNTERGRPSTTDGSNDKLGTSQRKSRTSSAASIKTFSDLINEAQLVRTTKINRSSNATSLLAVEKDKSGASKKVVEITPTSTTQVMPVFTKFQSTVTTLGKTNLFIPSNTKQVAPYSTDVKSIPSYDGQFTSYMSNAREKPGSQRKIASSHVKSTSAFIKASLSSAHAPQGTRTTTISSKPQGTSTPDVSSSRRNVMSPSKTISLPPMTVQLFADNLLEPNVVTYGHPDYDKFSAKKTKSRFSDSMPSGSAPLPVVVRPRLPTDEPYLLPDEARRQPKISARRSTLTTVSPVKQRPVRHNAQNPYSYRELFADDESPDYRNSASPSRGETEKDSTNIGTARATVLPLPEEEIDDYDENAEKRRDSSNFKIQAAAHEPPAYDYDYDYQHAVDYQTEPRYILPDAGSGTRNLYSQPLLEERPKKDEMVKTSEKTSKKMFSSQMERQKVFTTDNKKKTPKDGGGNNKMDKSVAKMIDGGASVVMGNLLPEDAKDKVAAIKALDVVCTKDVMNVTLQFDKDFAGVIYSKGHFGNKNCTYVEADKKKDFNFSVPGAGQCGTKFVEMKDKPAFLENILIIQNEPGIQEVWDSARGLRCVFDGKGSDVTTKVTAALAVSKIDQQVVSFSADTQATATLDIQVGRGPFAPSAAGLVKIGELMTLVVTVEGPEKAGLLVRQCMATDGGKNNSIMLTDNNGCVVMKKLMGSWQITKNTGDKKKPVIAFAHFQAFKFPDQMEVMIECQVDLCSGDCGVCQEDMKKTMDKMGRRRRRRELVRFDNNSTSTDYYGELEGGSSSFQTSIGTQEEEASILDPAKYQFSQQPYPKRISSGDQHNENPKENFRPSRYSQTTPEESARNSSLTTKLYPDQRMGTVLAVQSGEQILPDQSIDPTKYVTGGLVTQREPTPTHPFSVKSASELMMGVGLVLAMVAVVVLLAAYLRVRTRKKITDQPLPDDQSFHAFSSIVLR